MSVVKHIKFCTFLTFIQVPISHPMFAETTEILRFHLGGRIPGYEGSGDDEIPPLSKISEYILGKKIAKNNTVSA